LEYTFFIKGVRRINWLDEKRRGKERPRYHAQTDINIIIFTSGAFLASLYKIFLRVFEIFLSLSMLEHKAFY
jgi:hypothetical protein